MKIIVDSNIVFSAILNTTNTVGDILLNSADTFEFYSCEYLRDEIDNHQARILALSGYEKAELNAIQYRLYQSIHFIAESIIPFEFWQKAAVYVRDVDMDDIAFVALSLYIDVPIWTRERTLIAGLVKKGFQNLISTKEILALREK